jgi:hypothetical protein
MLLLAWAVSDVRLLASGQRHLWATLLGSRDPKDLLVAQQKLPLQLLQLEL